LMYPLC